MLQNLFSGTTIPVLEQVTRFNQIRHNVLAGNIANLDTPGYRTRDVDVGEFRKQLGELIEARHRPASRYGQSGSYHTTARQGLSAKELDDPKTILRHDGANVGVEYEVSEMVKNQMEHNLALSIMGSQFRLLLTAISERV